MLAMLASAPAGAKPKEIVVVGSKIKQLNCRFCYQSQQASSAGKGQKVAKGASGSVAR